MYTKIYRQFGYTPPKKGSPALPYRGTGLRLANHRLHAPLALTPLPCTPLLTCYVPSPMFPGFVCGRHSFPGNTRTTRTNVSPHLAEEFLDVPRSVGTAEAHDNTIEFYTFSIPPAFSAVSTRVQGRGSCARNGMVSPSRYKAAELVTWRHCCKFFESRR